MLSKLCVFRRVCNLAITNLFAAAQISCSDVSTQHIRRLHYSTIGKSRFSRSVDEDEERQFTVTFVARAAANTSVSTLPPSRAAVSPSNEASRESTSEKAELTSGGSSGRALSAAPDEQNATVKPPAEESNTEWLEIFDSLVNSAQQAQPNINDVKEHSTVSSAVGTDDEPASDASLQMPTPLELLPPRPQQTLRVSLLSRTHIDSIAADDASSAAEPTQPTDVYSSLFRDCFVNPFNGRLVNTNSPFSKLLFKVGFYRSQTNPLHLEWSPTEYVTALQNVMAEQQKRRARRKKKMLQQQRREQRLSQVAVQLVKRKNKKDKTKASVPDNDRNTNTKGDAIDVPTTDTQKTTSSNSVERTLSCDPLSPAEAIAEARAILLRPLRRHGPAHWMSTVAAIMGRQDVFSFLNKEMERLYANLCAAYVPPKLDTAVDVSIANMELTRDQKQVMQLALHGFNIFVGGSAGTGKTVLLKTIFRELTRLGLRVAMTATTGVAAVQLGGCTFHHAFNAPVDATPYRWDVNALRAVDVVIVDEVSLLDANMFDAFDMEARLARMCHVPFGGLQVIVCGDFLQLSREETMPAYESAAFKYLVAMRLVTPMRHNADDPLLKLLEELRRGEFNAEQFQALDRSIPASATHVTYIFPRRREAQQLNEAKLGELESREMTFTPQRGPLQLCGTFTNSALIEVPRDANGMPKPLPRREHVLDLIHAEAQRIFGDEYGGNSLAYRIADHELVLMPVRVEGKSTSVRFILRLRCRDSSAVSEAPMTTAATATAAADAQWGGNGVAHTGVVVPGVNSIAPHSLLGSTHSAFTSSVKAANGNKMLSSTLRKPHRSTLPFSESEWEQVAGAVAKRLGGRLVTMFSSEPTSMVPLSVSMTLADMTSPDVAHSLSPLRLKLGCRVMVNRNLSRTVSNGSVGIVEAFAPPDASLFPRNSDRARRHAFKRISHSKLFEQLPIVRLLSGEVVQVPPVSILIGGTAQSYYYGHDVLSIPLQLGYAFTVHKVQGLTLQGTVVLDCEKFFDCPHLIYVACSRVRRLDQLVVRHVEPSMIIVRRSALEFSDRLQEACALNTHSLPPTCVRGTWAQKAAQRILAISD